MSIGACKTEDIFYSSVNRKSELGNRAKIKGQWGFKCFDPQGDLKWEDKIENLVVNEGLDILLDCTLASGTQYLGWFVGLVDAFTYPSGEATDTMSSHSSWTEFTDYTEADRPRWWAGTVASQSVDNSSNKASFSINQNGSTIEGAFLNTEQAGTGGKLYAVGTFSGGTKSADSGDTLQVTATFTSADDGS